MILTTQALVLHTTLYSETSIIAKVFTRQLGLRTYLIKGVRSAAGRTKQNLLQPLSYLEMTVYDNPKRQLQYVKEMRSLNPATQAATDLVHSSLIFFMGEVLFKALREEEPNEPLFDYVVALLGQLDSEEVDRVMLPQCFLVHVATHLGIQPLDNHSHHEPLFHLKEGRFMAPPSPYTLPLEADVDYYVDAPTSTRLHYLLTAATSDTPMPQLSHAQRTQLLNILIEYMHIHLTTFHSFKSLDILHEVLE